MTLTIRVNGLELSHKGSNGWVRSTLPDVCKSPTAPVPYTNIAYSRTLAKGTKTVRADGGNMISILGSEYATSEGDEPGTGGGVISGVNKHRATWLSWSPNVFMEGRPVCRKTDKMLLNRGNTVSIGGDWEPKVEGPKGKDLCKDACECVIENEGKDRKQLDACFARKMREKGYNPQTNRPTPQTMQDGILSNAAYILQGGEWILKMSRSEPTMPSNGRPAGSRIPDVTQMQDGKPFDLYEMKFGNDDRGKGQEEAYKDIAEKNGGKLYLIEVDKDCDCDGYKKQKEKEEAKATEDAAARMAASAAMRLIAKRASGPIGAFIDGLGLSPAY